ncbi:MAG: FKBP-type peptidyl-prolyl cis-trans isomerase [Prevotella sp.]|nr:FKBP-type peptidyl-prolyl cis-trans isomerase [Prevotella sp.]
MKIEISSTTIKKICITAVFLLLLGGIGYMVYNHFDSKNDKEELASNINKAGTLSMFIIQDYAMTWQAAIKNEKVLDDKGNSVYNSDFNSAIYNRSQFYRNIGVLPYLDSLKAVIQTEMKNVDSDSKEDIAFTSSFDKVAKLMNLAIEPTGSLFTFNQNVNVIRSEFQSALDQVAIYHQVASKDSIEKWGLSFLQEKRTQYLEKIREEHAINKEQMKKEGFHLITDGIYYKTISKGDGKTHCNLSSTITVKYKGTMMNGIEFDKSEKSIECSLANVIRGWQIAIPYMTLGETAEFIIPFDLAYGDQGAGPIPPYANLRFRVKLISF